MLKVDQLRKAFGATVAVDGVSLEIGRGEVFGLLGPNGAGKSTTIGMCVGLIAPDSGSVMLDAIGPPSLRECRRHIGAAPQAVAVYDDLTGEENLRFFGRLYGLHGRELSSRVDTVLGMVGLDARRKARVRTYSGGMQRRLNLAAALVHDPPMLLLDEPTAGVDPQSRASILELVRELAGGGKTVLYTTHYMEEASRLCDRIAILDKGKLLALGTLPELLAAHGGRSLVTVVRAGSEQRITAEDPLKEIARLLSEPSPDPVERIGIERPDLETVFLSLTGRSLRD